MSGTLYQANYKFTTKYGVISLSDSSDNCLFDADESGNDSDDDYLEIKSHRKHSRLSRTRSLSDKRYRSLKAMIDDMNREKYINSFKDPDRKVTFTIDHFDIEAPFKKRSRNVCQRIFLCIQQKLISLSNLLSDWLFLAILGICVAFISISVDMMIYWVQLVQQKCVNIYNLHGSDQSYILWLSGLTSWCGYTVGLIAASATFVHYVAPQAIGSGIPEMKTIIRGVILVDYLTFKTLVSKVFGIAMALGSGVPIGKMGPFVHIASAVANQMCILAAKFDSAYREDTRRMECLAAACAVGVACTFSAPVGGVLFSIEVTTMYFSVSSYWKGFFAACCGATTIRLLRGYVAQTEVTVNAFYQTSFRYDAFSVDELPLFAILGLLCGFLGAIYISVYRCLVLFLRNNKHAKSVFQKHWIVYPIVISFIYSLISYPHGLGMFSTGRIKFGTNLRDFFSNCSFLASQDEHMSCGYEIYSHWLNRGNILTLLFLFILIHFFFSIISFTLPVPSGVFLPVFVLGAAIGRFFGELVRLSLLGSFRIVPGIYAVVGAASFSASVTHTVSVSVMIFEITGQLHFILPVMIAVMLANAICAYLQPSFFDTIIKIKHLPFLPDIPPANKLVHTTCAEQIMVSPVKFLTKVSSYYDIQKMTNTKFRLIPVVDSKNSQMLIGTVSRRYLAHILNLKIGEQARKNEAEKRVRRAIETIDNHFKDSEKELTEERRRVHSESDFRRNSRDGILTSDDNSSEKLGSVELNRFMVVPLEKKDEPQKYLMPPSSTPPDTPIENTLKRRGSLTRRNALFSLQDQNNKLSKEILNDNGIEHCTIHGNNQQTIIKGYMKQALKYIHQMRSGTSKKDSLGNSTYDLTPDERKAWEEEQLSCEIEFKDENIDPAPIQLVKRTSLYKIHSIFSMLQLSKAYVTDCGRLIGVVALSDVRKSLENTEEIIKIEKKRSATDDRLSRNLQLSTNIIDILTPTLEIAKSTTIEQSTSVPVIASNPRPSDPPPTFERKRSSLRQKPERMSSFDEKKRKRADSVFDRRPEEFVEAVAYLRRKSHALPQTFNDTS